MYLNPHGGTLSPYYPFRRPRHIAAKRKYDVQHINRKTKELMAVEIPHPELVAKYICMKTDNLQGVIDAMWKAINNPKWPAGSRADLMKYFIDMVVGPLAQQGISVEAGEDGLKFQWIQNN